MNALDTNLLLFAYDSRSPFHTAAKAYLESQLNGRDPVGIPAPCIHGFVRIASGPALGTSRMTLNDALHAVSSWLAKPHVRILHGGATHWKILEEIASASNATGNVFMDAAIAAIAIEHDAVVQTNDRDFARFPGVRWNNPLQP